mgnify:CR=1 FL=1
MSVKKNLEPEFEPISRIHNEQFDAEVEKLVKFSEDMRLRLMQKHQSRKMMSTFVFIVFVLIGATGFGWYLFMEGRIDIAILCVIACVSVPLSLHLWAAKPLDEYKEKYKTVFMPKLAAALGGFRFYTNRGVSKAIIQKTGVLPAFDTYQAEDCFIGKFKNTKVIFSEGRLYDNHKERVFDGIFVLLENAKPVFNGHTIITSDYNMVMRYAGKRWKSLSKVTIPNPAANTIEFSVFSNNPDAAIQLASEKLLKELSEASIVFNKTPITCVAFAKQFMFICLADNNDLFEPSDIHLPVRNQHHVQSCKAEINQILEIVDIFDVFNEQTIENTDISDVFHEQAVENPDN